jgi:hypothetical protein
VILGPGLLVGLASLAGFRRSRRRGLCRDGLLFTAAAVAALTTAAAFAPFDWRYQLPQLTLIPVAAILGITVLSGWRSPPAPGAHPGKLGQCPAGAGTAVAGHCGRSRGGLARCCRTEALGAVTLLMTLAIAAVSQVRCRNRLQRHSEQSLPER